MASLAISYDDFFRRWDKRCQDEFGVSADDLPDIIAIDDHWFDGMSVKESNDALDAMTEELRDAM